MPDIDVLVLAGGLGTRLDGVLTDLPKILAPIDGRPFLDYLLHWLSGHGVTRVVLGLGHRAGAAQEYVTQHHWPGLEVVPIVEPQPLGTAGAVTFALPYLHSDPVMVMNGDTVVEADLVAFLASYRRNAAAASVLCARVADAGRYGSIEIDSADRIARFREKGSAAGSPGWVNAGVYLFGRAMLQQIATLQRGSLERDVLERMPAGSIHVHRAEGRFLDIGTPESLAQAPEFFAGRPLAAGVGRT
jgi:mannose-1-phosphate guanylyltransferase